MAEADRIHPDVFEAVIRAFETKALEVPELLGEVLTYLETAEKTLIGVMDGTIAPEDADDSIEFALLLFTLHDQFDERVTQHLPATQVSHDQLEGWIDKLLAPIVLGDGSLLGFGKWEILDPGWIEPGLLWLYYLLLPEDKHPFVTSPKVHHFKDQDSLTIAVLGDWGTGKWQDGNDPQGPALDLMPQAMGLNPDLTIHLGDVYYAGTSSDKGVLQTGDEDTNFTQVWQTGPDNASYALNSNHENYPGAWGYFHDALNKSGLFTLQNRSSYFAFTLKDWVVVGLDSAYYSPAMMDLKGRVKDSSQLQFIQDLKTKPGLDGKQVMVLTHHTGIKYDGSETYDLWNDVMNAFGDDVPAYWYWGHIHNAMVYNWSPNGTTQLRCVGHSAIPFGKGGNVAGNPKIDYSPVTPYPNPTTPSQEVRMRNGFAMLTLTSDGGITEDFYEQGFDGDPPTKVWSSAS